MKQRNNNGTISNKRFEHLNNKFQGYPLYPAYEDVYNQWKEERDINPENIKEKKAPNEKPYNRKKEKNYVYSLLGSDLDIPGSELDDELEDVGSEDEENNYYSLGGDNHTDLEEDHG